MHPYQTDEELRIRVFVIAAFLSVVAAWGLSLAVPLLLFSIPWWIDMPSVLGFFGLFIWLFDNYLWRSRLVQSVGSLQIPDLNGVWQTEIKSSYVGIDKPIQARTVIRQTASKICIALETESSSSYSVHAALTRADKLSKFELTYNFINRPRADSLSTMSAHFGTAWLQVHDSCEEIDGEYYSGRGRQNFGRIVLRRNKRLV